MCGTCRAACSCFGFVHGGRLAAALEIAGQTILQAESNSLAALALFVGRGTGSYMLLPPGPLLLLPVSL